MCEELTETHLYRRLWLDTINDLGLVAEQLAEATGWQPTDEQLMPDALELAQVAARRIEALEQQVAVYQPKLKGRREKVYA